MANKLAKLAVHACARLGGYLSGEMASPDNPVTRDILNRLLTPYLARQLSLDKPEEVRRKKVTLLLIINLNYLRILNRFVFFYNLFVNYNF